MTNHKNTFPRAIILIVILCPLLVKADDGFLKRFKFNSINVQVDVTANNFMLMPKFGWPTVDKLLPDQNLKDIIYKHTLNSNTAQTYSQGYEDIHYASSGQLTISATYKYTHPKKIYPQTEVRLGIHIKALQLPNIAYTAGVDILRLRIYTDVTQFGLNTAWLYNTKPIGRFAFYIGAGLNIGATIIDHSWLSYDGNFGRYIDGTMVSYNGKLVDTKISSVFDQHIYGIAGVKYNAGCKINLYAEYHNGTTFYETRSGLYYRSKDWGISLGVRYKLFNKSAKKKDTFKQSPFWI